MKKFQNHDKYSEGYPRSQQRQKPRTEESRKFSKHDSFGHGESYFEDENMAMEQHRHSNQMERKSKSTSQAFVKYPVDQDVQKHSFKKTNEYLSLNESKSSGEHFSTKGNFRKFPTTSSSYSNKGNAYLHPKNPTCSDKFSKTDTRIKSKDEYVNIKICSDSVNGKDPSINLDVKSSFPLLQNCESNQSSLYCIKQNDVGNVYSRDMSKSVYTHEERANSESYSERPNSSQKAAFVNDSASYEAMGFSTLKLTDLLYYNVNLMQDQQLFEYASAVKCKILEKIDNFHHPVKDELEFLCEITDGDQSEKNQRIITARMCHIVQNIIEKFPFLLDALATSISSPILVYQSMPNLHGLTNSYCNNYGSPVLEIVQNSNMLSTSTTNFNVMYDSNTAENDQCVISKEISDSFAVTIMDDNRENVGVQDFNTNNVKNSSPIHSSLNTGENEDIAKESSEYCCSSAANPEECSPIKRFSFNEKDSVFIAFGLHYLLQYDVNAMSGDLVFDYAFSLKKRILKKIYRFENPHKEKLEFLCELTDGTQTEQNQKLINERMCELISSAFEKGCAYENSQNFSGEQSRNVHPKKSHSDAKRR